MKFAYTSGVIAMLAVFGTSAGAAMTPGTYTASINGHNAPMTVAVTVNADRIEKIEVTNELETIGVGKVAIGRISGRMVETQSIGVDNVTGATITSMALKGAVRKCLEQAGADVKSFNRKVDVYPTQDETFKADVVVVGGGGSGLAAAIAAHQAGAKVIVLEKLGILGGSTNVSEGALNAADPVRQPRQGIEDSNQRHYDNTMKGGHNKGDPALVKHLTDNAYGSVVWLEKLGVKFKDEIGTATGALWQRSHYTVTPSGNSYIRVFEKYLKEHADDIRVINDADVQSLIVKDGRVAGAVANNRGRTVTAMAADGVVIATGGFGANIKLRQEVNTGVWKEVKLDESIGCTNFKKSAQGSGIELGSKVGAEVIGMDDIQLHPCGTPGTGLMENIRTSGRNRIFVNRDGDRFVNEGAPRDTLCKAIFAQPGGTYYVVVNKLRYPARDWVDGNGATIANMVALGSVVEADTLDELAKKTGMDAAKLKASVAQYNEVASGKIEKDKFGFAANNKADRTLDEGPWYACRKVPTVHHTMGGLKINADAQVIGKDGKPIPGLYAAGEVTGGIHGSNRLGGNAIADVMTFGRTAGAKVVELK